MPCGGSRVVLSGLKVLSLVKGLCGGGRAVLLQLEKPVEKLHPAVLRSSGLLIAAGGGYIWAPIPTHRATTRPESSPNTAPWKRGGGETNVSHLCLHINQ